jgi:cell division protein FtsB
MLVTVGLVGSLGVTSVFGEKGVIEVRRLAAQEARIRAKAEALERENEKLRENVRRLRDDDEYLERVAREQQGLVRDGETVYRFPDD